MTLGLGALRRCLDDKERRLRTLEFERARMSLLTDTDPMQHPYQGTLTSPSPRAGRANSTLWLCRASDAGAVRICFSDGSEAIV